MSGGKREAAIAFHPEGQGWSVPRRIIMGVGAFGSAERQGQTVLMKRPGSTEETVPFSCAS